MLRFRLRPVPPFRLDLTVWALRRLPLNRVDRWDGTAYARVLQFGARAAEVRVVQTRYGHDPELEVAVEGVRSSPGAQTAATAALDRLLGLDIDLTDFARRAASDPLLAPLVEASSGLKPPRFPSVFEALVNGYACQQISLVVGLTLLNRLAERFGLSAGDGHAFPAPDRLAGVPPQELRGLGFSGQKAAGIVGAARAVTEGRLDLEALRSLDDGAAVEALRRLPGVGPWTAQYTALRGLGRLDVFPAADVGGQERIKLWMRLSARPDERETPRLIARWSPYRGFLYFLLLSAYQRQKGYFSRSAPGGAEVLSRA